MKYTYPAAIAILVAASGAEAGRFNRNGFNYYGAYQYQYPPYYPASPLSPAQKRWVIDREQRNEMPILNPRRLDPNILMVCDDQLSPDDIYTGLMAVLVRVEDTLRRNRCSRSNFAIHRFPVNVHTLLGKLRTTVTPRMQQHPYLGTYLDTMQARASQLIRKAERCQLDYVLLMKIVRMSMKLLVNKIMCGFVEVGVLRNRYGWPSKFRTPLGGPPALPHPFYNGRIYPYIRQAPYSYRSIPYSYAPTPYVAPIPPAKVIPAVDKGDGVQPVQKWPYYPPYDAPSNPYLGALGSDGKQLNGVDSGCKTCDKNRDVILT